MTINMDTVIIRGGQTGLAVSQRLARKIRDLFRETP